MDAQYLRVERRFRGLFDRVRSEDWGTLPTFEINLKNEASSRVITTAIHGSLRRGPTWPSERPTSLRPLQNRLCHFDLHQVALATRRLAAMVGPWLGVRTIDKNINPLGFVVNRNLISIDAGVALFLEESGIQWSQYQNPSWRTDACGFWATEWSMKLTIMIAADIKRKIGRR